MYHILVASPFTRSLISHFSQPLAFSLFRYLWLVSGYVVHMSMVPTEVWYQQEYDTLPWTKRSPCVIALVQTHTNRNLGLAETYRQQKAKVSRNLQTADPLCLVMWGMWIFVVYRNNWGYPLGAAGQYGGLGIRLGITVGLQPKLMVYKPAWALTQWNNPLLNPWYSLVDALKVVGWKRAIACVGIG